MGRSVYLVRFSPENAGKIRTSERENEGIKKRNCLASWSCCWYKAYKLRGFQFKVAPRGRKKEWGEKSKRHINKEINLIFLKKKGKKVESKKHGHCACFVRWENNICEIGLIALKIEVWMLQTETVDGWKWREDFVQFTRGGASMGCHETTKEESNSDLSFVVCSCSWPCWLF